MAKFTHRVYNFNAGPAMLPDPVMEEAQRDFLNYRSTGMSVLEISHRSSEFQALLDQSTEDLRELLQIPSKFGIVFFPGGATLQFSAVPLNYLENEDSADFSLTGLWANKAYQEAQKFSPNVKSIFDGKVGSYTEIPSLDAKSLNPGAKYLHITSNNTIYGTRYSKFPELGSVPIVADMTSDILSRPIPWNLFSVVFAGAQKNIGPSGLTLVIFDKERLPKTKNKIPNLLDYALMEKNGSLYNTPPTFSIYIAGLVFRWLKNKGGLSAMEKENEEKAKHLYDFLDQSSLFFANVPKPHRSIMNVVFKIKDSNLEKPLLESLEEQGFCGLKGYRDVGGFRASIYNAMPKAGVEALVSFLRHFESKI